MQGARNFPRSFHGLTAWLLAVGIFGCERAPTGPITVEKRGPEERFERIVDEVKRLIGGDSNLPGAGVGSRSNEITSQTTRRKILDELIPPSEENPKYTGRITVESKTTFAAAVMPRDDEREEPETSANSNVAPRDEEESDPLKILEELSGADQSSSKGGSGDNSSGSKDSPQVREFTHENITTIELSYVDDKWVIVTDIEDGGMLAVFEAALNRQ